MSAYVVNAGVIGNIIAAACERGVVWEHNGQRHSLPVGNLPRGVEVGRMLWAENIASVLYRYPQDNAAQYAKCVFDLKHIKRDNSETGTSWEVEAGQNPVVVSIRCLDYQSCEHPAWESSEAFAFLMAFQRDLERPSAPAPRPPVEVTPRRWVSDSIRVQPIRIQRFGRGSSRVRSDRPLSDQEIRQAAPSIFAENAHGSRSERYSYIPTVHVLTALRREGFEPFAVHQGGSGDLEKREFTKHMIRLRHASNIGAAVGSMFPEIVLINSHDGTSSYQLMAGVFRLVCSNGMVVGEGQIEQVRVRHTGNVVPEVVEGCNRILAQLPGVSEQVREWDSLVLSPGERDAFARAALAARYDEDDGAPIQPHKLLAPRRREDAIPTMWNTLNTVQENMIRGGVSYVSRGDNGTSLRRTREVKGIDQDVRLNRALWTLAAEMQKIKNGAAAVVS